MPRAGVLARGDVPPPLGSFQDELLREVDEREKNLRFAEVDLLVKTLIVLLGGHRNKGTVDLIADWVASYSAELYQDVYVPEWAVEQRAALRRKQAEQRRGAADKAAQLAKVARMSGDG